MSEHAKGNGENGDSSDSNLVVVGMGASAGGLEAFSEFLRHMPSDSGMAFVLVQHLDPTHESIMPELLAKDTAMPVRQVQDETPAEPDHVYVIPPNASLTIEGGVLRVEKPAEPRGRRMAIDAFFESLAADLGPRAICVVLSGTGSDGTLGLRAIKEHGGLAIAQAPDSARYDSMPRSAISTRLVDHVLAAREMPPTLVDYARRLQHDGHVPSAATDADDDAKAVISRICGLLHRRTGHDFSRYKRATLHRRLQRRMRVLQVDSLSEYADRLVTDASEIEALFRDLLISVTQFFREPDAFEALTRVAFPHIFHARDADSRVRIWVPGCATGEEVYTIAMLACEYRGSVDHAPRVQIFATDIDEHALEFARNGRYPEGIAEHVSPERLDRFFIRDGAAYVVKKELRELCLFSPHNVIKDPPFSTLDMLSCRNLLIYLEPDLQRKLIPVFHYALQPEGFLLLGPTENVASYSNLFRVIERKHHIYQAQRTAVRQPVEFPLAPLTAAARREFGSEPTRTPREHSALRALEHLLLETFAPSSAVINERGDVAYFIGRTGKFLAPPVGAPTNNLLEMAREGLRLPLRTAVYRAVKSREPVVHEPVVVQTNGHTQSIRLTVRPLKELTEAQELFIVIFEEVAERPAVEAALGSSPVDESLARQLDAELRQTREQLQATIEEMEAGHEELKSANEELLSMNEELQSSNEQLQTSKEELQSVNEELGTVNAELQKKVEELDRTNSDLQNLLQSTGIATIFLDSELRIQRFTPGATHVFRIIDTDVGRPIIDLAPRFQQVDVHARVSEALRTLTASECEVSLTDRDRCYMMRIHPYRTTANAIAGVVMTFVDVTDVKRAQLENARLAAIVETSQDCIIGKDLDGIITSWNAGAERLLGYSRDEVIGQPITMLIPPDCLEHWQQAFASLREGRAVSPMETARTDRFGQRVDLHIAYAVITNPEGRQVGISSIGRDVRPLKAAEAQALKRATEIEAMMEAVPAVVWIAHDPEGERITGNAESYRLLRMPAGSNQSITAANERPTHFRVQKDGRDIAPEDLPVQRACRTGQPVRQWENDIVFADGDTRRILGNAVPLLDESGRSRGAVAAFIDVTDLKSSQQALTDTANELRARIGELEVARRDASEANKAKDRFIAILSHELRTPLTPVLTAVQLADKKVPDMPPELRKLLRLIERNVSLEARLIDDLLDLNRLAQGTMRLERRRMPLDQAVIEAVEMCRAEADARDVRLDLSLTKSLAVEADPARLQQIVWNLVRNAVQHSQPGATVTITTAKKGRSAVLSVTDTGDGIRGEDIDHIFDAFERGPVARPRPQGLGLGLAICKALVGLHEGTIAVESLGEGRGAAFTVTLPLPPGKTGALVAGAASSGDGDGAAADLTGRRVLFVEDHDDTAEMMTMMLSMMGLEVTTCRSVAQALNHLNTPFDLLVSDIGLPDGSGIDLIHGARANGFVAPALALTGFGMESDVARVKAAGFNAHLTKPVDAHQLKALMVSLLDSTNPQ